MPILGVRVYAYNVVRWLDSVRRAEDWFQTVKAQNADWFPDKNDDFVWIMRGAEAFGKSSIQHFSKARYAHEHAWRQRMLRSALQNFYQEAARFQAKKTPKVMRTAA